MTLGEGDEIQDRLSDLSNLCGKFLPLIFELEVSVQSLDTLLKLFRDTWDLMKTLIQDPINIVVSFSVYIIYNYYSNNKQIMLKTHLPINRIGVIEICNGTNTLLLNFKNLLQEEHRSSWKI